MMQMRTFTYTKLKDQLWDSEVLSLIAGIYKEVGKQELYLKRNPAGLERLSEVTKYQSIKASNEIEGITTSDARLKKIVDGKMAPESRNEKEIAGYRDVFSLINGGLPYTPITPDDMLQMHQMLYGYEDNAQGGRLKNVQNYISAIYPDGHSEILFIPTAPDETREALNRICEEYNIAAGSHQIEPLILISVFIHDFLCIHPFHDGNGRISRLLTGLLLYQRGFMAGKYISMDAKIARHKDLYYSALQRSQTGWHEGSEDFMPFVKYILCTILAACKDLSLRMELADESLPAVHMVRKASMTILGKFTKQDLLSLCPALSLSSLERSLRILVEREELKKEGRGKATFYYRIK